MYLKHVLGGGRGGGVKAALGFEPDWIKTFVSMATEIPHSLKMGE